MAGRSRLTESEPPSLRLGPESRRPGACAGPLEYSAARAAAVPKNLDSESTSRIVSRSRVRVHRHWPPEWATVTSEHPASAARAAPPASRSPGNHPLRFGILHLITNYLQSLEEHYYLTASLAFSNLFLYIQQPYPSYQGPLMTRTQIVAQSDPSSRPAEIL